MVSRTKSSKDRNKTTAKGRPNRASSSRARITKSSPKQAPSPGEAPTRASLPPGRKGGAIVPREAGGALARRTGPSGSFKAPRIPKAVQAVGKAAGPAAKVLGTAGKALGAVGMIGAAADIIGQLATTSEAEKAINARIARDSAAKAEQRVNPNGDRQLANARADRKRLEVRNALVDKRRAAVANERRSSIAREVPSSNREVAQAPPSRNPQSGPSRSIPTAVTRPMRGQSSNMDENYATWTKANKTLAEKVKPGQAGYNVIQKTLKEMKGGAGSGRQESPRNSTKPIEKGLNLSDMRKYGTEDTTPGYESPAEKEKRKKNNRL